MIRVRERARAFRDKLRLVISFRRISGVILGVRERASI